MGYLVYFDSGTSNSRGYLLDSGLGLVRTASRPVGSKDSAISGSNRVLIDGLYDVYTELLDSQGINDRDVEAVYASGMVTSPYGLKEVPHLVLPVSVREFAGSLHPHLEQSRFRREIILVPGLKTAGEDIFEINNMRGEEIELIGLMPDLAGTYGNEPVAVVMPGSHTHILRVRSSRIEDVISNFTGELFHAIRKETILAPVLSHQSDAFDSRSVLQGLDTLKRYGFNRALYICHAMRLFNKGTHLERLSYAEGVILGGISQSLGWYCGNRWTDLHAAVIVAPPSIGQLYKTILEAEGYLARVDVLSPGPADHAPALEGMRTILAVLKGGGEFAT